MATNSLRTRFQVFLVCLFAVMVLGTAGFMLTEGLSLTDAVYFSIVTIATVGYGDIHPATQAGKVVAIFLIITGVGTFLGVVANATEMMLNRREREVRHQKLNMIIGVFFSEVGMELLALFSRADPHVDKIKEMLVLTQNASKREFEALARHLKKYRYTIDPQKVELQELRDLLSRKTGVLLRLLENPNILEHESFSDLLRAVFHLNEELRSRRDLTRLPDTDKAHLAGDAARAYRRLVHQWLDYMKHLKEHYPYLYSLAMRTNPFDKQASPIVT